MLQTIAEYLGLVTGDFVVVAALPILLESYGKKIIQLAVLVVVFTDAVFSVMLVRFFIFG